MTDVTILGVIGTMLALNLSMLGLMWQMMRNGKPKHVSDNPHPTDPDDIRLGDISLAYFRQEFVEPIVQAIKENRVGG